MENNYDIETLKASAIAAFGVEQVSADEQTVRLTFEETTISLCMKADAMDGILCRAFVAGLTRLDDPAPLCQEALEANFFCSGTNGAMLSIDPGATALYLTARLLPDELDGPEAMAAFISSFTDTLVDWRLRVRSHQGGLAALPASADFNVPQDEQNPERAEDRLDTDNLVGLEVFR